MASISQHSTTPQHVAIIMDGNGRWAAKQGMPRTAGHRQGAETLRNVLEACRETGVRYLTLYAFSSENWSRPEDEISDLMDLLKEYIGKELPSLIDEGIRLRFIGDRLKLDSDIQHMLADAEEASAENSDFQLIVALSYGSRDEIVRTVKKLVAQNADFEAFDEAAFSAALDTHGLPDPDLLIRTGGECRLSNFLMWQLAYTELYFTAILWPEFSKQDFSDALAEFASRERRYGNIGKDCA